MNTKKDEPEKKETAVPAGQPGPRPHATLDLKATVVDSKAGQTDKAAKGEKPPAASADPDQPAVRSAAAASGAAAAGAQEAPKPGAAKPKAGTEPPNVPPPEPPRAPAKSAGQGFFTHLAAGVAGGIMALLAADLLASQLGFGGSADPGGTSALQQRIVALEAGSKQTAPALTARLEAAEGKLAKLDRLGSSVERLRRGQDALTRDVKALDAKVGAESDSGNAEARVSKLEEQLAAMSAAAERNPDGGGLPQLANLTGKIADLEQTMTTQLDALRKSVNAELDTRLAAATEAGETAKSGTQRIDRELAGIKADTAQLATRLNPLEAQSERAAATLQSTQEELTRLKVDLNARLPTFAKPEDVTAAVTPLAGKLSALEQDVQGVVKSEGDRKATAGRIVMSLELANLKRAIDRGKGYAPELAQARKLSDGSLDLAPLARFESTGVPTLAELRQDFKAVAFKMIDAEQAPAEGSIVDRLLAGARSVVRVRKISHEADDRSVEAVVARMEAALGEDRLDDVLDEAKTLPQPAQDAAQDFLAKVEARNAVDRALATVESQLKASLVAPAGAAGTSAGTSQE
jgi:outer membrane murein-binding lipoprotein Lpp